MAYSETMPDHMSHVSVDPREMESFARMAEDWWNPEGMFRPLHIMNAPRIGFIKSQIGAHFGLDENAKRPLAGLRLLDIGCGGGLLCEPMTRLGAQVTGVDALEKNVKIASAHAKQMGLDIDYRHGTIEQLVAGGEAAFDVVLNMEVIEHVAGPEKFIADCAAMVRGREDGSKIGGMMICSSINRTMKAFLMAIVGAEYVLRWLPKGTHQYDKLVRPKELTFWLENAGLIPNKPIGMSYDPLISAWSFTDNLSINYVCTARK